jgi:hypothetical protein
MPDILSVHNLQSLSIILSRIQPSINLHTFANAMIAKLFYSSWYATLIILVSVSCTQKVEYPETPEIAFKDLILTPNEGGWGGKVRLVMSFTDGDGDLGLSEADTVHPYKYNLFINLFQKINGSFVPVIFPDSTLTFNARIPVLTTSGHYKVLKGDIFYDMDILSNDTMYMDAYIIDKALHESNIISTPEFIIK